MKPRVLYELFRDTVNEWIDDKATRLAAALAYYSAFSLAPLLVLAIGIAGLIFGEEAARDGIREELARTVGPEAGAAIQKMIGDIHRNGGSIWATIIGVAILLFGASGVFVELQDALDTIWKVKPKPGRGIWNVVRERALSFAVVLGTCFLLLVSLVISTALAAMERFLTTSDLPGGTLLWQGVSSAVSLGFITLLFALIYKLLPDVKISWKDVWLGALLAAVLFSVGKYLLGLYIARSGIASGFGAAAALVVIMLWVFYSSLILLFGAEFTRAYARRFGSHVVPADNAVSVTDQERAEQGMHPAGAAQPSAPARVRV